MRIDIWEFNRNFAYFRDTSDYPGKFVLVHNYDERGEKTYLVTESGAFSGEKQTYWLWTPEKPCIKKPRLLQTVDVKIILQGDSEYVTYRLVKCTSSSLKVNIPGAVVFNEVYEIMSIQEKEKRAFLVHYNIKPSLLGGVYIDRLLVYLWKSYLPTKPQGRS